jgi:hypothetical protein
MPVRPAVSAELIGAAPMIFRTPGRPTLMTVIRVAADLTRADIPGLCADLADRLRNGPVGGPDSDPATVVCDVRAVARPDVVTVEALARLGLTARRHGRTLVVDGADARLRALVDLLGLTEPLGQPEQREQPVGVEEVVDARDPPA